MGSEKGGFDTNIVMSTGGTECLDLVLGEGNHRMESELREDWFDS